MRKRKTRVIRKQNKRIRRSLVSRPRLKPKRKRQATAIRRKRTVLVVRKLPLKKTYQQAYNEAFDQKYNEGFNAGFAQGLKEGQ